MGETSRKELDTLGLVGMESRYHFQATKGEGQIRERAKVVEQWSPIFWAPGTSFMEDNFFMNLKGDGGGRMVWG